MKTWTVVAVVVPLAFAAILLMGCGGVWMNAEYTALLNETAALSNETATRAEARKLDPNQTAEALRAQSCVWYRFVDARDGKTAKTTANPSK